MPASLNDAEAISICKTYKPKPAQIARVLAWATGQPHPNKLPWLLLLDTDRYVSQGYCGKVPKSLTGTWSEAMQAALRACVALDGEPLWAWLAADWETTRMHTALVCLLSDAQIDLTRLEALGMELFYWFHWSLLRDYYERRGLPFPAAMAALDEHWKASSGLDAARYRQRRQAWGDVFVKDPPRVKPVQRPSADYGARTGDVSRALRRIESWYLLRQPEALGDLQPGLTVDEIDALVGRFPLILPEEVYELYRWRNGSGQDVRFTLDQKFHFLSLQDALRLYEMTRETNTGGRNWFHFASWGSDWTLYVQVGKQPAATAKVMELFVQNPPSLKRADSLADWLLDVASELEQRGLSGR